MLLTTDEILSDAVDRLFYPHFKHYGYPEVDPPSLNVTKLGLEEDEVEVTIEHATFCVEAVSWVGEEVDVLAGCTFDSRIRFVGMKDPGVQRNFNQYARSLVRELINILAGLRHCELDTIEHDPYFQEIKGRMDAKVRRALNKGKPVSVLISIRRGLIINVGDGLSYKYDTVHPLI